MKPEFDSRVAGGAQLYFCARRRGYSPHDAQDLTQGFFLHLLQHRALTRVARPKGKFRSFPPAPFQNYLWNEAKRAQCFKRGGSHQFVSLDWESAESRYRLDPADHVTPENIYDARWAMTLLDHVMVQLGKQYAAQRKEATFEALQVYLRIRQCSDLPSYEEVAKTLGVEVSAVKILIHRLRKQYKAILLAEVGRMVSDPSEIDALYNSLMAAEGRMGP